MAISIGPTQQRATLVVSTQQLARVRTHLVEALVNRVADFLRGRA